MRVGRPTDFYPWPWPVVSWIEGEPAVRLPPEQRDRWATDLADVMIALHVPADEDAPANPVRGVPLAARSDASFQRLARGTIEHGAELRSVIGRHTAAQLRRDS